ncbi:hypothetical protein C492_07980 [Natronococcus jeotgali DSM 18795]|uniref:Uncharacterized protein n=1 Tax=Natronococcus jeotgali DSM 18795 TaxID=1227498 RepID=L9XPK9_9EURY|nr:hypothetical protein C492_07980 [Natronococcus jeotgali DSM 18795]
MRWVIVTCIFHKEAKSTPLDRSWEGNTYSSIYVPAVELVEELRRPSEGIEPAESEQDQHRCLVIRNATISEMCLDKF